MPKKRSELKPEETWNVEELYPSLKAWEEDFQSICKNEKIFQDIQSYKGKVKDGAKVVKEILDLTIEYERKLVKIFTYAHLRHDEEVSNSQAKSFYDQVISFYFKFEAFTAWIQPEILQQDQAFLDGLLKDESLSLYHIYLEKLIRQKPHTLSETEEKLIAQAGKSLNTAQAAFGAFNNADIKFPNIKDTEGKEYELSHGQYFLHMQSKDRTLRKNAFEKIHEGFQKYENTLCELLSGHVQTHLLNSRVRHYNSCLEAALFPNQINVKVYTSLIDSVKENLTGLHDYIALRKKRLGLDKIYGYDMYVPTVGEWNYSFSYEEAKKITIDSVSILGEEYQNTLRSGLNEQRWVDPFENESKRSGAYSSGCYDSYPYILMNFHGTLNDLMTLAHEAGHSMHSQLSRTHQPYIYSSYSIFVAEVASTFNEELTFRHLLNHASSKEEKAFLINQKIDGIRATFFRQALFAEFELKIHELAEQEVPLTPDQLKEIYKKLNQEYYGEDFVCDDFIIHEYLRIPHFYSNFYVYQYATGIAAALCLVEKVVSSKDPSKYLKFLSSGSSDYPISLLKEAGVDMETKEPVECLCNRFNELVQELKNC